MMKNQSEVGRLLADLLDDLQRGAIRWQIVIIALALLIAWQVARHLRRRLAAATVAADPERTMKISVGGMNRELFPVTALELLLIGRWALENYQPIHLLNIAVPLVLAMAIIRGGGYLLGHPVAPGGRLRSWEGATSWLGWSGGGLHRGGSLAGLR